MRERVLASLLGLLCVGLSGEQHFSPRETPTRMPVLMAAEDLRWQATEFKGVASAVLWGDPENESQGGELLKVEGGLAFPRHKHSYDERVLIISGTFVFISEHGKETELRPGSYYYLPAGVMHASRCSGGSQCVVYSEVLPRPGVKK